jgi:uracil-DNA glycosylase family 4
MKGFFTSKETKSDSRPDGKTYSCASCSLYKDCKTPRMKPFGNFNKGILNIGEAPGETEDVRGRQWQGKTGQLLQKTYQQFGIDLFEDCLNINACNCRPIEKGSNRTPTPYEIDCCRRIVLKTIEKYQPKLIVLLGGSALYSLIGHRWKKNLDGIMKWRGFTIPDKDFQAWICPVFHPSFVDRSEKEVEVIWKQDLEQALSKLNEDLPRFKKPIIETIEDLSVLDTIKKGMVAFDYETTGIKPHAVGHRIVCASVAYEESRCYIFLMPKTKNGLRPLIRLLNDSKIDKVAQNMKYEDTWTNVKLRTEVNGWSWDTMLAAHILDNRPGITGLKFQVYVNFGVIDYSSKITPYLQSADSKNGNNMNRIFELLEQPGGKEKLLTYCGWDSLWEYRLAMKQMKIMDYSFLPF